MRTKTQAFIGSNTYALSVMPNSFHANSKLNFTTFSSPSLFFISQLRETQSNLKQESTLQYNDEEAQLQMRFRRIMVSGVKMSNDRENCNVT